jgi:ABC-type multidrug transport system fused ATPase/permease subunit
MAEGMGEKLGQMVRRACGGDACRAVLQRCGGVVVVQLNNVSMGVTGIIIAFTHGWELTLVLIAFLPIIGMIILLLLVRSMSYCCFLVLSLVSRDR